MWKVCQQFKLFIKESLRYIPVVIWTIPHEASRDGKVCGFPIPANQIVLHNLYAIHHRERDWPKSYTIRPRKIH
eukprot:TRINITY_DN4597_c0_g1_i1.p1 TRINITY_DN4597_c0_g1~~TRINITY_DN4597_c0_g1_i1.p1  ORF type:complete len:74 (-),score=6.67 TRINITY_DN4597_c0_g1_i1:321-542(-)